MQPGELLDINLLATDQINNSREAIWSLQSPGQDPVRCSYNKPQTKTISSYIISGQHLYLYVFVYVGLPSFFSPPQNLDALSSNNDTYVYTVPAASSLPDVVTVATSTTDAPSNSPGTTPEFQGVTTAPTSVALPTVEYNFTSSFTLNFSLLRTLVGVVI